MNNLEITLANIKFKNPILNASGTAAYGKELEQFIPLDILGGFVTKSVTYKPRFGNPLPRIAEGKNGILNCIGLTNPGIEHVANIDIPYLTNRYQNLNVICSVAGGTIQEYIDQIKILNNVDGICAYEINISCPNVQANGNCLASDINLTAQITKKIKSITQRPIFLKLTPNVTDISKIALACENNGADAVIICNSYQGMRIDLKTGKPILSRKIGGYSGPAIFPMVLKNIYQCAKVLNIPIIGSGGVSIADDVIEMMYAGASLVEIGAQNLVDPYICQKIINDLPIQMKKYNIKNLSSIIKGALKYE